MEKLDARMGKFVERLNFRLDGDIRLEFRLLASQNRLHSDHGSRGFARRGWLPR
jgi:hypothetical protein